MATPKYKSGRIWVSEVRFEIEPAKVKGQELTSEINLHMAIDKNNSKRGAIRLDLLITGPQRSVDAYVCTQVPVQSSSGGLASMPAKVRAAIARRLYDKARTIIATLSDQMGFPPLILSDTMDIEEHLQAAEEGATANVSNRRPV